MKSILVISLCLLGFSTAVLAEETLKESATAKVHDAKRAVKKGVNRAKEAVCAEGDVKCLEKKAEHRAQEGADYVKDKAKAAADKVDSDSKANQ